MRNLRIQSVLGALLAPRATTTRAVVGIQSRWAHGSSPEHKTVPSPIPLVPDVETFLRVIGRGMKQHAPKFPSWEALFTLTSAQLRELGIEPARDRRYLLRWLSKFRLGEFGIGGDFKYVENGTAELKVLETKKDALTRFKTVVNVPATAPATEGDEPAKPVDGGVADGVVADGVAVKGYKVRGAHAISGPFALPLKANSGARVTVTEGMWEHKRGRKIDGGERRRAEVRFKRRAAERKSLRESQGFY